MTEIRSPLAELIASMMSLGVSNMHSVALQTYIEIASWMMIPSSKELTNNYIKKIEIPSLEELPSNYIYNN